MRKHIRILSAILTVLVMAMVIPTSAVLAKSTLETALFDVQSLGIMTGDENGDMNLDESVTRAEFTAITTRLMNMEAVTSLVPDVAFKDVPSDYWAKGYINLLSSLNIINGAGDGFFEPEGEVTLEMASKILVNVLGYYMPAEDAGGYPSGYLAQAQKIGLLDGVDRSKTPLTRTEIVIMAYNALDINMVVEKAGDNGKKEYVIVEGETLRSHLRMPDGGTLEKYNGIVTANIDTYLEAPISDMEVNEIEINGQLYQVLDPGAKQYLGQSVDFYLHDDQVQGKAVITSITPTSKNRVYDIPVKDIKTVQDSYVEYFLDETGKTSSKVRFNSDSLYVYNNVMKSQWSEDDLKQLQRGTLRMIDNDQDGTVEVMLVKEYNSAVVDEISKTNNMIYFKDGFNLYGKKYLELTPDDPDLYITLEDSEGNAVTIEDIEQGDILSAYENGPDDTRIEVIFSDTVVNDVINQIKEDEVTIGDEIYKLETDDALGAFKPGDRITAYVNFNNEIVFVEKELAKEGYGYVLGVASVGSLDAQTMLRVLIPDVLAERFDEEENADGGEATKISKIACKNKEIQELTIASKVNIDGEKLSGTEEVKERLLNKVISFTTNANGEVNRVTFPVEVGKEVPDSGSIMVGQDKTYNSYEKTFGKTSEGAFGVNENTLTICVPKVDETDPDYQHTDNDFLVNVEMNNGQQYTVKAFDQNQESYTADLIVVQAIMRAGSEGLVNTKSKVGFVMSTAIALNDNDEEVQKIELLTEGDTKSYLVSQTLKDSSSFREIKQGELIAYSLDGNDELDKYKSLSYGEKLDENIALGLVNGFKDNETFGGYLVDATYNQVSNTLNRWVHKLDCGKEPDGSIERSYEITKFNGPPVFLYNTRNHTAQYADVKEIRAGIDKIFVSAANNTVRAIVIIR